jgi:Tfp pilus assembly protein PilF
MRNWAALLVLLLLSGCATTTTTPVTRHSDTVFQDQLFAAPTERYVAADLFALSEPMKHYIGTDIASELREKGGQRGLFDALYAKEQLKLEYDATMTRTAAEAFAARSGNCLSLVILTAAFAKSLDIPVRYQLVYVDDVWSRSAGLDFFDSHVNVTLGARDSIGRAGRADSKEMTIDFLPPANLGKLRTRVISEQTIVSMFMNNRAAELLTERKLDRAYWWSRAAVLHDRNYIPAYNTLGVIYKWHGNLQQAEMVFNHILGIEPENAVAMSNLILVLNELGRTSEANAVSARLKTIRPVPPFHYFDLGMAAMKAKNYLVAKAMFTKQIQRDAVNDQSHFWLAIAYYNLGDLKNARKHLGIAGETSTTKSNRELYAAKLAEINAAKAESRQR